MSDNEQHQDNPGDQAPDGNDPKKTDGGEDTSKQNDGEVDYKKILEDPNFWKQPAIKELVDIRKEYRQLTKKQQEAEETQLKEQQKFEELATKTAQERDEWRQKYTTSLINNAIITEASKLNPQDLDGVLAMIDKNAIEIDEDGNVSGVSQAVLKLKENKPYLFSTSNRNPVGAPPNSDANEPVTITTSELRKPGVYNQYADKIRRGEIKVVAD